MRRKLRILTYDYDREKLSDELVNCLKSPNIVWVNNDTATLSCESELDEIKKCMEKLGLTVLDRVPSIGTNVNESGQEMIDEYVISDKTGNLKSIPKNDYDTGRNMN